ncbi:MAG: DUF2071 domain-containing protein [Verrucomicrobia bacterium]|nr:DUF2071 domain-containing protein [Verrucomicrobiota bacterium]
MRTPILCGVIKRRFALNYRADPEVVKRLLPAPFHPKLYHGYAIVGVCLVRLESLRPRGLPPWLGVSSENAVHRIASEWIDSKALPRESIFVARRDTDLWLSTIMRGKLFISGYHRARFAVEESIGHVEFACRSLDKGMEISFSGDDALQLPASSCFKSLQEDFFCSADCGDLLIGNSGLGGIALEAKEWKVRPFRIRRLSCSFFDDRDRFPTGSIEFDHALVMRDIAHAWHLEPVTARLPSHTWLRPIEPSSSVAAHRGIFDGQPTRNAETK